MGFFTKLFRCPKVESLSNDLSSLIMQVGIHEYSEFSQVWGLELGDEEQVIFFLEYCFMLISVVDRLAFNKFDEPFRGRMVNLIVNNVKVAFCGQKNFGSNDEEKGKFFEQRFGIVFNYYSKCTSIMGEDENQIILNAAIRLVDEFVPNNSNNKTEFIFETGKKLAESIIALFKTTSFEALR